MKTEKKQPLIPPVITETSTEEERALAADFKKQRFTALIMKSVFLGLTLLACLFSLFLPSIKRVPAKSFGTDYSLTISVADGLFGSLSLEAAKQADIDSFVGNGGLNLISPDNDEDKKMSASDAQILADVAYKRTLSFSKMKAQFDIEAFITAVNLNMEKEAKSIQRYAPQDKAEELVREYYKETQTAVGVVFDLFSYEIERNNYAGLGKFLNTVEYDLSETNFRNAAEKFLIGKYKWNEAFRMNLETAVNASSVVPELQDEFYYSNEELTVRTNGDSGSVLQIFFCFGIGILNVIMLIHLIVKSIFLFKQFRKQDAPLKPAWNIPFALFCASFHVYIPLFLHGALFAGAFGAGVIVIAVFFVLVSAAQIVHYKHLLNMRAKFLREE